MVLSGCAVAQPVGTQQSIYISEFVAASQTHLAAADGQFYDWIELHNPAPQQQSLDQLFLSDDIENPLKWALPAIAIPANSYLVVFASNLDTVTRQGQLHTNFKLSSEADVLLLTRQIDGIPIVIDQIEYPQQFSNVAFVRTASDDVFGYQAEPSPERQNRVGVAPELLQVSFSHPHGLYDEPFILTLESPLPTADIIYTLDGSWPTLENGQRFTAPIQIEKNTVVRAVLSADVLVPHLSKTQTYLFPSQTRAQADGIPEGYPAEREGLPMDYGLDTELLEAEQLDAALEQAWRSIPTMSLVMDVEDIFGQTGLYQNSRWSGRQWERAASLEYLPHSDSLVDFSANVGVRIQGHSSRLPVHNPKHSFRIVFRTEYGQSTLQAPLFDAASANVAYNEIVLKAGYDLAWVTKNHTNRPMAQYTRDEFARRTQLAMGQLAGQGRVVHLYINGLYWGVYNLMERPTPDWASAYLGGEIETWEAQNGNSPLSIAISTWDSIQDIALNTSDPEQRYTALADVLDVANFIDFMLLNHLGGNASLKPTSNWYAVANPTESVGLRFVSWDAEETYRNLDDNTAANAPEEFGPQALFISLLESEQFRNDVAARLAYHTVDGGALSTEALVTRYEAVAAEVAPAILAESVRWGDYRRDVHAFRDNEPPYLYTVADWEAERERLLTEILPQRTTILKDQYAALGIPTDDISQLVQTQAPLSSNWNGLVISEIMYQPDKSILGADLAEFVELANMGVTEIDLSGYYFSAGIRYTFPPDTTLAVGERLILARNPIALTELCPRVTVFGAYADDLRDQGEAVELSNPDDVPVLRVHYHTSEVAGWPHAAAGVGSSLERRTERLPYAYLSEAAWWQASETQPCGSPGS